MQTRLAEPGWRAGTTTSTATVRNELHALSNLFTRLELPDGSSLPNPVKRIDLPAPPDDESEYLQLEEMARLLDAAVELDHETSRACRAVELLHQARSVSARGRRTTPEETAWMAEAEQLYPQQYRAQGWHRRFPHLEALFATLFYTGGRSEEGRGLMLEQINWLRRVVYYRENQWRGVKSRARAVPMWPEYHRILRHHVDQLDRRTGLAFVGRHGEMTGGLQTIMPRCVERAEITRHITPHALRHTFATAMLHTYEVSLSGDKVRRSSHDVAILLGHGDSRLVDSTYGHLLWDAGISDSLTLDGLRQYPSTRLDSARG
jgi:integrase